MTTMAQLRGSSAYVLLVLLSMRAASCPAGCSCSTVADHGQWVYCAVHDQEPFPKLPVDTVILDLRGNHLRGIPAGSLDQLEQLRHLYLEGNNWECGCQSLYLKHWLEDQKDRVVTRGALCILPSGRRRSIVSLSGNEYTGCDSIQQPNCLVNLKWNVVLLCCAVLSVLLLCCAVIIARNMYVQAKGFIKEPGSL